MHRLHKCINASVNSFSFTVHLHVYVAIIILHAPYKWAVKVHQSCDDPAWSCVGMYVNHATQPITSPASPRSIHMHAQAALKKCPFSCTPNLSVKPTGSPGSQTSGASCFHSVWTLVFHRPPELDFIEHEHPLQSPLTSLPDWGAWNRAVRKIYLCGHAYVTFCRARAAVNTVRERRCPHARGAEGPPVCLFIVCLFTESLDRKQFLIEKRCNCVDYYITITLYMWWNVFESSAFEIQ